MKRGEVKLAERFLTGYGLVQCFKCCSYRYIVKNCRAKTRCGHYSESHETRSCSQKTQKSYTACKASGHKDINHKAQNKLYPVRVVARKKLRTKLESRPYLYTVIVDPDRRPLTIPAQKRKLGRPPKEAKHIETDRQPIDVDIGREHKRKRQSTLLFGTVKREIEDIPSTQRAYIALH